MRLFRFAGGIAGLVVLSIAAGAQADDPTFDPSLASPLLQSKAQIRIFAVDDAADTSCKSRKFVDVDVVTQPSLVQLSPRVRQKKWQEQWTIERCGQEIGYRMFFTDLGDGGAYFSYSPMPTVRVEGSKDAKATVTN